MATYSIQSVKRELDRDTENILACLNGIADNTMMLIPSKGSWSLMECFEHVHALEKLLNGIFQGPVEHTQRDASLKAEQIWEVFNNDNRKLNAPEPIAPRASFKNREVLEKALAANREQLIALAEQGPDELCMAFGHHYFGNMTRLEWLYFCLYHSERHLRQAERIKAQIANMELQS